MMTLVLSCGECDATMTGLPGYTDSLNRRAAKYGWGTLHTTGGEIDLCPACMTHHDELAKGMHLTPVVAAEACCDLEATGRRNCPGVCP